MPSRSFGWSDRSPAGRVRRAPPPPRLSSQRPRLPDSLAVRDQGNVPCCVSCAIVSAMEVMGIVAFKSGVGRKPLALSVTHHFRRARGSRGFGDMTVERGMSVAEDGIVAVSPPGDPSTRLTRARVANAAPPPRDVPRARIKRRGRRVPAFKSITHSANAWVKWLQQGHPVIIGLRLPPFEEFSEQVKKHPANRLDCESDSGPARHCVVATEFSDGSFRILDSFGSNHGEGGHWWLPAACLRRRVVARAWVIREVEFRI